MTKPELTEAIIKRTIETLHALEDGVELSNAINPDPCLNLVEIALHAAIVAVAEAATVKTTTRSPGYFVDGTWVRT